MCRLTGVNQRILANFKTEKEALAFAEKNKGSEVVIKENNGSFSVHTITDELSLKLADNKVNVKDIAPNAFKFSVGDDVKQLKEKRDVFKAKAGSTEHVFDSKKTVKECFDMASNYPNVKVPGFSEKTPLPKGLDREFSMGDFYSVLGESGAPNIHGGGNKYEKMVGGKLADGTSYISRLQSKILESDKNNLTPKDVMKFALDATGGDYGLASLAAHNLLKNLTYNGRFNGPESLSKDDTAIISKLGNLRDSNSSDKMGPWYHFFGVQASFSLTERPAVSRALVDWEHTIRSDESQEIRHAIGAGMEAAGIGEKPALSPVDHEKGNIDYASCDLADQLFSKYGGIIDKADNLAAKAELGTLNLAGRLVSGIIGKSTQGYRLILEQAGVINPQK